MKFFKNIFNKSKNKPVEIEISESEKQKMAMLKARTERMVAQKRDLSLLLLQKMVKIYYQDNMVVDYRNDGGWNPGKRAIVSNKEGRIAYSVGQSAISGNYWAGIPGKTFETGGDKYFSDDKHDYLRAVYDLVTNGWCTPCIDDLMNKQIRPNLVETSNAWIPWDMDIFKYLDIFLEKQK